MTTQPTDLYKQGEQAIPLSIVANFVRMGSNYKASIDLLLAFAFASVPCEKCCKTSRELLKGNGVEISDDDTKVDMLLAVTEIPEDEEDSAPKPSNVFVIISACINDKLLNTDDMIDIDTNSKLGEALDQYVGSVLKGKVICNGCYLKDKYFDSILSDQK